MIKTFHEAPKSIFSEVQALTDGDYALVNLFEDEEYYQQFKDAVSKGREVILDNGVFELGKAFDSDVFATWVERLKPTYYIIPDVLEDCDATIERFHAFRSNYPKLPGKVIGVVQGKNYRDFVRCYRAIAPYCDKIGISFDCSWYKDMSDPTCSNPWLQLAAGRSFTLMQMLDAGIICKNKPHHLLGVALPQEMREYHLMQKAGFGYWIDSVDTSNPVVHGLKGIVYSENGLTTKETQKLYTMINAQVDPIQKSNIEYNIKLFRRFCNG